MVNKYKKSLVIVLITTFILILILVFILSLKNKQKIEKDGTIEEKSKVEEVKDDNNEDARRDYYTIKKIVDDYYNSVLNIRNTNSNFNLNEIAEDDAELIKENQQSQISKIFYSLGKKYREDNNITINNVMESINEVNISTARVTSINRVKEKDNITAYYVLVDLKSVTDNRISETSQLVYIDKNNNTYEIFLDDYIKKNYSKITNSTNIYMPERIEKNNDNTYSNNRITDGEHAKNLLADLMYNIIFKKEKAYELLDNDYKSKRFANFNVFYEFISNNEETYKYLYRNITGDTVGLTSQKELESFRANRYKYDIKNYKVKKYNNYIQYIIIDRQNKYYIFNEEMPMEYHVVLDSYTVEVESLTEEYNKLNNEEQYAHAINQYIEMINLKDYNSAYSHLDENLKNDDNKSVFEKFIKERFFEDNYIDSIFKDEKDNQNNVFKIQLRNSEYGMETKGVTIKVELITGNDYKITFL